MSVSQRQAIMEPLAALMALARTTSAKMGSSVLVHKLMLELARDIFVEAQKFKSIKDMGLNLCAFYGPHGNSIVQRDQLVSKINLLKASINFQLEFAHTCSHGQPQQT